MRQLEDGREVDRISSWLMPNIMSVPDIQMRPGQSAGIAWVVPVDDSHYVHGHGHEGAARLESLSSCA